MAASRWWQRAEDSVDRTIRTGSQLLFAACCLATTVAIFAGEPPLRCLAPQAFTEAQVAYSRAVCPKKPQLYLIVANPLPTNRIATFPNPLPRLPLLFLLLGVVMATPYQLWSLGNAALGYNANDVMRAAADCELQPRQQRRDVTQLVAEQLRRRRLVPVLLSAMFLLTKAAAAVACVVCQLLASWFFGLSVWEANWRAVAGGSLLPEAVFCDFQLIRPGPVIHRHTLQCTFTIQRLVNFQFLVVSLWLTACAVAATMSLICWTVCLFVPPLWPLLLAPFFSDSGSVMRRSCDQNFLLLLLLYRGRCIALRDIAAHLEGRELESPTAEAPVQGPSSVNQKLGNFC